MVHILGDHVILVYWVMLSLYIAAWQPGQGGPHQWDDLPTNPVIDDPNQPEPNFGPPSMEGMQQFQGYENTAAFGHSKYLCWLFLFFIFYLNSFSNI